MRNSLTPKQLVSAVSILAALALAWTSVARAAIGGSATYVVTDGISVRGPTPTSLPYVQTGTFAYSAAAVSGAAYPSGRATTGDPLFLRLVRNADFGFSYRFTSAAPHRVDGMASLVATLASTNGWKRTIVLAAPHAFEGNRVTVHGTIDLRTLGALLTHLESTTQVAGSYTVSLTPHVRVRGTVSGEPVSAAIAPVLSFSLDPNELEPVLPGAVGHPSLPSPRNPLRPASSGSVTASRLASLAFSFAGRRLSVSAARIVSLVGLVAALCLLVGFAVGDLLGDRMHATEAESILSRYRSLLVQVAHVRDPSTQRVVVVSDMAALARIAERYDRMILHEQVGGQDSYFVADDGVLYRYEAEGTRPTLVTDVASVAEAG